MQNIIAIVWDFDKTLVNGNLSKVGSPALGAVDPTFNYRNR